jgi:hypothetical protein
LKRHRSENTIRLMEGQLGYSNATKLDALERSTQAQCDRGKVPILYSLICTDRDMFSLVRGKIPCKLTHHTCGCATHINLHSLYHYHLSAVLGPAAFLKVLQQHLIKVSFPTQLCTVAA